MSSDGCSDETDHGDTPRTPPTHGAAGSASVPILRITQDDAADELLGRDPLALLLGMLLDQHMRQRSSGEHGRPSACPAWRH